MTSANKIEQYPQAIQWQDLQIEELFMNADNSDLYLSFEECTLAWTASSLISQ